MVHIFKHIFIKNLFSLDFHELKKRPQLLKKKKLIYLKLLNFLCTKIFSEDAMSTSSNIVSNLTWSKSEKYIILLFIEVKWIHV